MELNDRVTQLENEIKILKSEIQVVLLDLRENCLNRENPFNSSAPPQPSQRQNNNHQPAPADKEEPVSLTLMQRQEEDKGIGVALEEPPEELELTSQSKPIDEPAPVAREDTANDEGTRAWRPQIAVENNINTGKASGESIETISMATITELSHWVTETVKRLGHKRTEGILDIMEMMGHLAPELKNILVKFINHDSADFSGKVTAQDYLAAIMELGSLLGRDNKSEVALLYILCQENDHR